VIITVKQELYRLSSIVRDWHRGYREITDLKLSMAIDNMKGKDSVLCLAAAHTASGDIDIDIELSGQRYYALPVITVFVSHQNGIYIIGGLTELFEAFCGISYRETAIDHDTGITPFD
jgi:hypothetical protein